MTEAAEPKPIMPASAGDWRKLNKTTTVTTLAYSGLTVEIGTIQMDQLLLAGKIPDLLTPIVAEALWSPVGQGRDVAELSDQKGFFELVNIVVGAALIAPRVVAKPAADDEIAIDDLSFLDKITIYRTATQPLGVLHRFRVEQEPTVDAVPEGEDVQPATE